MIAFRNVVKQETPRLVIIFQREGDKENFQWGMVGNIPVLSLIGHMVRVQAELPLLEPGDARHHCPESALVIAWDDEHRTFDWFINPNIPMDPLVGMMDMIRMTLLSQHMVRHMVTQQPILGPDGKPIPR